MRPTAGLPARMKCFLSLIACADNKWCLAICIIADTYSQKAPGVESLGRRDYLEGVSFQGGTFSFVESVSWL